MQSIISLWTEWLPVEKHPLAFRQFSTHGHQDIGATPLGVSKRLAEKTSRLPSPSTRDWWHYFWSWVNMSMCLEKKFTHGILNKIRSFLCTRLIFTRAHCKVGRSVWWRFHSNRLTLLALAELWKNVLKLHIFVRLRIATENSSHALSPLQKKNRMHVLQICCFNRHPNLQSRMNCGPDGAELQHTTLLQCLGGVKAASTSGTASSAASWHCGVEWSPHSPDPSLLDFFLRVMLRLKRIHAREPLTVIEFNIAIARESPRSPDQCRRTVDHYRHFRFLSFFTHFFKVPPKLVKWVDLAETFTRHFSQPWDKPKQKWDECTQNCGFYSIFIE